MDTEAEELRAHLRMEKIPTKMTEGLFRYNVLWDKVGVNILRNKEHIRYYVCVDVYIHAMGERTR